MIYAAFSRPEGIFDSFFNKTAAFVTGRGNYCHSEFIFRWTDEERQQVLERVKGFNDLKHHKGSVDVAVYILWGDHVRYRILNGATQFWTFPQNDTIRIQVNWEKELNTITWLSNQIGAQYDTMGALLCQFPLRKDSVAYESYFCSQLMGCALKRLGFLNNCNPAHLSPNSLYRMLVIR